MERRLLGFKLLDQSSEAGRELRIVGPRYDAATAFDLGF
jgi:hypothetical protein